MLQSTPMGEANFELRKPSPELHTGRESRIEIRPAQPGDFDQLLSLFDAVALERQWIGTEPGFNKAKYRAAWQSISDEKGGAHFVACVGNEIAGAVSLYPTIGGAHDLGILVSRERRGRGIGTELLREAFAWARQHGIPELTLGVFPHNAAAINLYAKLGFVEVGRLEGSIVRQTGDVWDVILMEKEMRRLEAARSAEPVTLESYNVTWAEIYSTEAKRLHSILARFGLRGIEHVGSTAIPGMTAKPIVDILAGVQDMDRLPALKDPIWSTLGYEWGHGGDEPKDWLYFIKRDAAGNRVTQLHVVPFQGEFWNRLIAFRDALREDPDLARQYEALKTGLASKHGDDRLRYRDEKAAFVHSIAERRLRRGKAR